MPWWAVAGFTGYALVLMVHATIVVEELGLKALWLLPFFLVKFAVLIVALSYWTPPVCQLLVNSVGTLAFVFALYFTAREAFANLKLVLFDAKISPRMDNLAVVVALLATVVFPGVLLAFAARVLLLHECAKI